MRRNNTTITSVRVHPRFEIGSTWYDIDSGYVEPVTILSKPNYQPHYPGANTGMWVIDLGHVGHTSHPSLGDRGVRGFNYDNRPAKLVSSMEQAKHNIPAFDSWMDIVERRWEF